MAKKAKKATKKVAKKAKAKKAAAKKTTVKKAKAPRKTAKKKAATELRTNVQEKRVAKAARFFVMAHTNADTGAPHCSKFPF
jgi:F0F1-type ATP synthase membrane subunit b/b'